MKNILLTALGLFMTVLWYSEVQGQDRGLYTQYFLNQELINPAYTGYEGDHKILFNYRNRMSNFPGTPKMYTFAYSGRVGERVGLGGQIVGENVGALNRLKIQLQYSYLFSNNDFDFGLGLTTEYQQYGLDNSVLVDPRIDALDPWVQAAADNLQFFDVSLGFHGEYKDEVNFGVVLPSVLRARINEVNIESVEDPMSEIFDHYFFYFGYDHHVAEGDFHLKPSLVLKNLRYQDFAVDVNMLLTFLDEKLLGGLSYSFGAGNRLGFLAGTRIDNFQFAYSYDASFMDFQDFNTGGHEFTLGLTLGNEE